MVVSILVAIDRFMSRLRKQLHERHKRNRINEAWERIYADLCAEKKVG